MAEGGAPDLEGELKRLKTEILCTIIAEKDPLNSFSLNRNYKYGSIFHYSVQSSYPQSMKALW